MATIAGLRTGYLNGHLGLALDAATLPWTTTARDQALTDALAQSWPDLGLRSQSTVATSEASDQVAVPAALEQGVGIISRIDLEYESGGVQARVGRVTSWQWIDDGTIRVSPMLPTLSGLHYRFIGWVPFALTGADLPVRLERAIAARGAALCFGDLAGQLANSERQQGLDRGQVVDYPTAVGLSAYWERRYFEQIEKDPARPSVGPRRARR